MQSVEARQRQNKAAELQRNITTTDAEIRKCREKLHALKRARPPTGHNLVNKKRLPTEVSQVLCQLRDSLRTKMKEVAALKKEKSKIIGIVDKTAEDEEKTVQKVAETSILYVPSAQFMKYDPAVVAKQRLDHAKTELASVHSVIDAQMQHMNKAFETAARKAELDRELLVLQEEIQKKKEDLYQVNEECASMKRVYDRKKLCLARAPAPLDPMEVLQLDQQREVSYDSLNKQESAAVAAKESIAYRANLLCQLERQLKVMSDGVQSYLDALSSSVPNSARENTSTSEDNNNQQQQESQSQQPQQQEEEKNKPVRATALASIRQKISALNNRDQQLDEELKKTDVEVSELEYKVKVMVRATETRDKERNRLLRQHEKHIGKLQQSIDDQAAMARQLIDEERSRSVSIQQPAH